MSNLSSAASEEKPDFPRFASEDDTEICDLLLTVDNVSIYSDDCKERAFVPTVCLLPWFLFDDDIRGARRSNANLAMIAQFEVRRRLAWGGIW